MLDKYVSLVLYVKFRIEKQWLVKHFALLKNVCYRVTYRFLTSRWLAHNQLPWNVLLFSCNLIGQLCLMAPVTVPCEKRLDFRCVSWRAKSSLCRLQGRKTFCASFCASLIAGSRRAFLRVDCVRQFVCLSLREFWLRLNEMHKVWTFASRKAFLLLCGFCFSSLENYFGLATTTVKGKTDHPFTLRWNKEFWTFPKRRAFFWLFIRFICELISPSFARLN